MTMEQWDYRTNLVIADTCMRLGVPFYWRGPGTMLVAGAGLAGVLQQLSERGVSVIGLEGFEMANPDIHPRLDLIYDANRSPAVDARSFSSAWPTDIWVDIVLDTPNS